MEKKIFKVDGRLNLRKYKKVKHMQAQKRRNMKSYALWQARADYYLGENGWVYGHNGKSGLFGGMYDNFPLCYMFI